MKMKTKMKEEVRHSTAEELVASLHCLMNMSNLNSTSTPLQPPPPPPPPPPHPHDLSCYGHIYKEKIPVKIENYLPLEQQILSFNKTTLRNQQTTITTPDGQRYIVKRTVNGIEECTWTSKNCIGFVVDTHPDRECVQIIDKLWLGSQDAAADLEQLKRKSITHILNVAPISNYFPNEFVYLNVPLLDGEGTVLLDVFPQCFEFIHRARDSGGVLVHCNAGVSRSAAIVIGYCMQTLRKPFEEVFQLVKQKRPVIQPNTGFIRQLKAFEKTLSLSL